MDFGKKYVNQIKTAMKIRLIIIAIKSSSWKIMNAWMGHLIGFIRQKTKVVNKEEDQKE